MILTPLRGMTLTIANEDRFFIIGLSSRRLLYVVYAERQDDIVRIISARRAVETEQELYERPKS